MKKLISLVLALLFVIAMAGASAQVEVSEPGVLPIVSEPITLTVGMASNVSVMDWETNEQTLAIEAATGINLEFIDLPKNEFVTKINLMVAADGADLPDILIGAAGAFSKSVLVSWAKYIIPLNDYYDSGMNYFMRKSIEEGCSVDYDTFVNYMTCFDGNIYALPSYSESYNNEVSSNRLIIYDPWLEQLGIARGDIQTTDDLYDVLCQFRDNDMNGNGDPTDEIPFISSINQITEVMRALMNPFIYTAENFLIAEDGVIDVVFDRDEFREGIRFARKLVDEGLFYPESFTQDEKQMTALQSRELPTCGVVGRVSTSNLATSDNKYYEYRYLDPLMGPEGVRENPVTPSVPTNTMIITTNCKNPDAAFRLGDYLCSEEMTIWGKFGRKGIEWHEPLEGELSAYTEAGYPTVLAKTSVSWADVDNFYWANQGPRMYGTKLFFGQADTATGYQLQFIIDNANDLIRAHSYCDYDKLVSKNMPFNEEQSDIYDSVYTPIITKVNEYWSRFVLGDLDIESDSDWEGFINTVSSMGLEEALESIQEAYDALNA